MKDYIWIVTEHRNVNGGIPVSTSHYYRAESEDKAKAKYAALCAKYTGAMGCECVHDDRFATIEDINGEELRSSFRDFRKECKGKVSTYEVEIGPEIIK